MMIDESGLPVIPHEWVGGEYCCGCLIANYCGDEADIICNECSVIVRKLPATEAAAALTEMAWSTGEVASATCPHCGAVNVRPGFAELKAVICSECGEGASVE